MGPHLIDHIDRLIKSKYFASCTNLGSTVQQFFCKNHYELIKLEDNFLVRTTKYLYHYASSLRTTVFSNWTI